MAIALVSACTGGDDKSSDEATSTTAADDSGAVSDGSDGTAAGTGAGDADDGSTTLTTLPLRGFDVEDNVLVWVHDLEPTSLHYHDPAHQLTEAAWIRQGLLEGLYGVSGNSEFYPELLADDAAVTTGEDGSVVIDLVLREGLRWSNGDPLTTADLVYTWDIWREGCELDDDATIVAEGEGCVYRAGDRAGYDLISGVEAVSELEARITMSQFFAGWRGLFDELYHPSFGAGAAEVNDHLGDWVDADGKPLVSSGPLVFREWDRGFSISLKRNARYHGSMSPDARSRGVASVDAVFVRFVPDTETVALAIENRQAHVVMVEPELEIGERLAADDGFTMASATGSVYEHWGFNLLDEHLADPAVREAIAYAVDKSAVVEELYGPLFGNLLPREGLGNSYWMTNQRAYEDHQVPYAGAQVVAARQRLETAGYVVGDDDVYTHPSRGRLELRVGTTGGNGLRERQQAMLIEQLAAAGISARADNVEGDAYFVDQPFHPDALLASITGGERGDPTIWDIAQFGWAGRPSPGANSQHYVSGAPMNPYGFANEEFDVLAATCDMTVDRLERAACYNELDRFLTTLERGDDGLVVLPLTQRPSLFGYTSDVVTGVGIASDADAAGPLVNIVDFEFR